MRASSQIFHVTHIDNLASIIADGHVWADAECARRSHTTGRDQAEVVLLKNAMLEFTQGDILKADAEALVNTVNCVGVMGRGIALQFKKAFPENFKAYATACKSGDVQLGRVNVFDRGILARPRYLVNFPTKGHWRENSRLVDIERGLADLVEQVRYRKIQSIAIPPLGCGLGGLDWAPVQDRIESAFAVLPEVAGARASTNRSAERIGHAEDAHPAEHDERARGPLVIDGPLRPGTARPLHQPARSAQGNVLHARGGRATTAGTTRRGTTAPT